MASTLRIAGPHDAADSKRVEQVFLCELRLAHVRRRSDRGSQQMISGTAICRVRPRIVLHRKRQPVPHPIRLAYHLFQLLLARRISAIEAGFHPQQIPQSDFLFSSIGGRGALIWEQRQQRLIEPDQLLRHGYAG